MATDTKIFTPGTESMGINGTEMYFVSKILDEGLREKYVQRLRCIVMADMELEKNNNDRSLELVMCISIYIAAS